MAQIFSDVNPDAWYYKEIERGALYGLLRGFDDGTYRPDEPMTRAQSGVVMTRIFERIMFMTLLINGVVVTGVLLTQRER